MPNQDPDLDLVRALQAGEETALNELIARHQAPLFRFIFRFTAHEEDARELTQETFVRVYFKINTFQAQAKFSTWLYRIATNLCRDRLRSRQHRENRTTDSFQADRKETESSPQMDLPDTTPTAFEAIVSKERMAELATAISQLPPKLREALVLSALENMSHAECGEILRTTAKSIELRVYRARKLLMEKIDESDRKGRK